MGWKNVKTHYRIEHIVQVREGNICIGSGYLPEIIVIDAAGNLVKSYDGHNDELSRYQAEMKADLPKLRALVEAPDSFETSLTVYTYETRKGVLVEKQCETPGYPNVTHDGILMYENTFSTDKAKVVRWAKDYARDGITAHENHIRELQKQIAVQESYLAEEKAALAQLEADYPGV